jgi:hypothetical protein
MSTFWNIILGIGIGAVICYVALIIFFYKNWRL